MTTNESIIALIGLAIAFFGSGGHAVAGAIVFAAAVWCSEKRLDRDASD